MGPINTAINELLEAVRSADPWEMNERNENGLTVIRDDGGSGLVSGDHDTVEAILNHPDARVRPLDRPIPVELIGRSVGDLFGRLIRMRDDAGRTALRQVLETELEAITDGALQRAARDATQVWLESGQCVAITAAVPDRALARLLGIEDPPDGTVEAMARAIAPGLEPVDIDAADQAVNGLRNAIETAVQVRPESLAARVINCAHDPELDRDDLVANLIGFLFQNHDATAGLLGSVLQRLRDEPDTRQAAGLDPSIAMNVVREVVRRNGPVHLTRRWAAANLAVPQGTVSRGGEIVLLLAATQRTGAPNDLGFGAGPHRCPGRRIALGIVAGAIGMLAKAPDFDWSRLEFTIRPLRTTRVPEARYSEAAR